MTGLNFSHDGARGGAFLVFQRYVLDGTVTASPPSSVLAPIPPEVRGLGGAWPATGGPGLRYLWGLRARRAEGREGRLHCGVGERCWLLGMTASAG